MLQAQLGSRRACHPSAGKTPPWIGPCKTPEAFDTRGAARLGQDLPRGRAAETRPHATSGGPAGAGTPALPTCLPVPAPGSPAIQMWWPEAAPSGRGGAPRPAPPLPLHPGGRDGRPGGRRRGPPAPGVGGGRPWAKAAGADTWRRPGSQERVSGAENKAPPSGKAGWRPGRETTFWGAPGIRFVGQAPLQRGPTPRQGWVLRSDPKASPASGSTSVPLPPAPLGGPRDPPSRRAAPAQSRAGGGEAARGRSLGSRAPASPPSPRGRAPLAGGTTSAQKLVPAAPQRFGANFPEPPLPARPGSPPTAIGKRPAARAPLLGERARLRPRGTPLRPNLPPPKGRRRVPAGPV